MFAYNIANSFMPTDHIENLMSSVENLFQLDTENQICLP